MSLEAEQAVLGSILIKPVLIEYCYLKKEYFQSEMNAVVFEVLKYAYEHLGSLDLVVIAEKWGSNLSKIGGISYLMKLRDSTPSTENFIYYQSIVLEEYTQSEARKVFSIANHADDINIAEKMAELEELLKLGNANKESGVKRMVDVVQNHSKELSKRSQRTDGITGAKTLSIDFDKMSGGHQKKDLIVVAARPSVGKTAMILNDMLATSERGNAAYIASLEMGSVQMVERMISIISGIESNKMRSGLLNDSDWHRYGDAIDRLADSNLFIDDSEGQTVEYIDRQVSILVKEYPNLVLYVDFIQFLDTEQKITKQNERIAYITKKLKGIAKKHNIPVVAISAVGRGVEQRPDKRPMMSDLRESGSIESDADVIIFLYRDDMYYSLSPWKGHTELIVAKGRNIGTGTIYMRTNFKNHRFTDMTKDEIYELKKSVKEHEQTHRK